MQSGPKKSPKVHTSGKYRGGVRTCAQVCLTSPPHPALAPPLLTPPTAGFRIPASQTSPRRLLRRLASAPSTSSTSSSWWSSRRHKSRRPGSRERSFTARTAREYVKSAIIRAHLAHSRVPRNLARSAPWTGSAGERERESSRHVERFSVIVLLLLTSVFHYSDKRYQRSKAISNYKGDFRTRR